MDIFKFSNWNVFSDTGINKKKVYDITQKYLFCKNKNIQLECLYFFGNIVKFSNKEQKIMLIKKGLIHNLFEIIIDFISDDLNLLLVLKILKELLNVSNKDNLYFDKCWIISLEKIISVENQTKNEILKLCEEIKMILESFELHFLEKYFKLQVICIKED